MHRPGPLPLRLFLTARWPGHRAVALVGQRKALVGACAASRSRSRRGSLGDGRLRMDPSLPTWRSSPHAGSGAASYGRGRRSWGHRAKPSVECCAELDRRWAEHLRNPASAVPWSGPPQVAGLTLPSIVVFRPEAEAEDPTRSWSWRPAHAPQIAEFTSARTHLGGRNDPEESRAPGARVRPREASLLTVGEGQ